MKKEMLINVLQPEECRIAIVEDGVLEELYVERTSQESYVGNIYKGRIVNIEPSIQAAFVDFGIGRNGFLHVSDVEPAYYRHLEESRGDGGRGRGNRRGRDRGRGSAPGTDENLEERFPDPEDVQDTPVFEPEDVAKTDAEAEGEARPSSSKGRSRSRGRPRRRTRQDRPEGTEAAPEPEDQGFSPEISAAPDQAVEGTPAGENRQEEPPQFMNSAEHRTEEDKNAPGRDNNKPAAGMDDEDIFFPRSDSSPSERPAVEAEPVRMERAEPVFEESFGWQAAESVQSDETFSGSSSVANAVQDDARPPQNAFEEEPEFARGEEVEENGRVTDDLEDEGAQGAPGDEPQFRRRRSGPGRDDRRGRPRPRM